MFNINAENGNFRELLNKLVFVRSTHTIEELAEMSSGDINGFYGYVFWASDGSIYVRILDVGYGMEDYFEAYNTCVDFLNERMILPLKSCIDDIIHVFTWNVIADDERYSTIVASEELSNQVSEGLIEMRERAALDPYRDDRNQDELTITFYSPGVMFKSKAKVQSVGATATGFRGKLLEIPFGWQNLKKGDQVSFKLGNLMGRECLLAEN